MRPSRKFVAIYLIGAVALLGMACAAHYAWWGYVFSPEIPPVVSNGELHSVDQILCFGLESEHGMSFVRHDRVMELHPEFRNPRFHAALSEEGLLPIRWDSSVDFDVAPVVASIRKTASIASPHFDWSKVYGTMTVGRHRDGRQILLIDVVDPRTFSGELIESGRKDEMVLARWEGKAWEVDWHAHYKIYDDNGSWLTLDLLIGVSQSVYLGAFVLGLVIYRLMRRIADRVELRRPGFVVLRNE